MSAEKTIICFCEDITVLDIKQAISQGYTDIETLKRFTGLGTGTCQGKMCIIHAIEILAEEARLRPDSFKLTTQRPPIEPVEFEVLAQEVNSKDGISHG